MDEAREELDDLVETDGALDRGFRHSLLEVAPEGGKGFPGDLFKVLLKLFHLRRAAPAPDGQGSQARGPPGRGGRAGAGKKKAPSLKGMAGSLIGAHTKAKSGGGFLGLIKAATAEDEAKKAADLADPFLALKEAEEAATSGGDKALAAKRAAEAAALAALTAPLSPEADLPEGTAVDPEVWDRLQELRRAKILNEVAVRAQQKKVAEMRRATEAIDRRDRAIAKEVAAVEAQIAALEDQKRRNETDFELLVGIQPWARI